MASQRLVSGAPQGQAFLWSLKKLHRTHRGVILLCISSQGNSYTPLCWWMLCDPPVSTPRPGTYYLCVSYSFPRCSDFCSEPAAYSLPPGPIGSKQASFLKQMAPTISNISEKEMQEDQCAFLFPWADYSLWAQTPTRPEPRSQWWLAFSFCVLLLKHLWNFQDFLYKRVPGTPGSSYR